MDLSTQGFWNAAFYQEADDDVVCMAIVKIWQCIDILVDRTH